MHSFLIIGSNNNKVEGEIETILKRFSLKRLDFLGLKIDEIRKLNSFVSLSLKEKTAIVIKDIDKSTNEAMNAFLKNLEEPQENLYYILTAANIHKVIPTISSRCQIIFTSQKKEIEDEEFLAEFIKMKTSQKLLFLDKIGKRKEAIDFFYNLVEYLHQEIKKGDNNLSILGNLAALAEETLSRLEKNGNINLQLTYFAVNSDNFDTLTRIKPEV